MTSIESLYSDRAKAVLDNYFPFPEPKTPVRYNFDQGVPAPKTARRTGSTKFQLVAPPLRVTGGVGSRVNPAVD